MRKDTRTLFPAAERLKLEPKDTPPKRDDLSQIRVIDRDSDEGRAILAARAARKARRDVVEGVSSGDVALAGKLATA